jgi:hypothetical protein
MKSYESGLKDNGGHEAQVSAVSTHDLRNEGSLERNTILMFTCINLIKIFQEYPK